MGPARSVSPRLIIPGPRARVARCQCSSDIHESRGAHTCFRMRVSRKCTMVPIRRCLMRPPSREGILPCRARNPRSPSESPPPSPICRGSGMAAPSPICRGSGAHPRRHPRFAGDRGSIPTAIPDLPESGIQLSTIDSEYCKGVEFRLPQCLTLRLIVLPKLCNLRRPAMSDDAVDYSGTISSGIRSLGGVPFDCAAYDDAYHVGLADFHG
jgi:hypothetical protein